MMNVKKILSSILVIAALTAAFNIICAAEGFVYGDYFIIGKYNNEPILWRYIDTDENGKLLLSDNIICSKEFGVYSWWEKSPVREWLNCDDEIVLNDSEIWKDKDYKNESGFLYDGNFPVRQRALIKTVDLWTSCTSARSENGITDHSFSIIKTYISPTDFPFTMPKIEYYTLDEVPEVYYGAAYQTRDSIFLPDALQLYNMKQNVGTVSFSHELTENEIQFYYMRSEGIISYNGLFFNAIYQKNGYGIRPAFYLDEEEIDTVTGSGTLEAPYVLNGADDEITVRSNNEILEFDVRPVMRNDRVLVPLRAIFESLGAQVEWNDETQTVTAERDDRQISLQIDNNQMHVNNETIILDAKPILRKDRTMIPLRAVSESLGAAVEWDEGTRTAVITG